MICWRRQTGRSRSLGSMRYWAGQMVGDKRRCKRMGKRTRSRTDQHQRRLTEIAGVTLLTCIRLKCTTMFDGCNTVRHAGCTEAAHQDVSSSGSSDSA